MRQDFYSFVDLFDFLGVEKYLGILLAPIFCWMMGVLTFMVFLSRSLLVLNVLIFEYSHFEKSLVTKRPFGLDINCLTTFE